MSRYMILVEERESALAPDETDALLERRAAYAERLGAALVDGERFRPANEGRRVGRGGVVEDRDANLGGYYVVEAPSLEAAGALAHDCPGGEMEVRPVLKGRVEPGKKDQPGRTVAFAVLGSAPNEESWVALMDRIDDSTNDRFPNDRFAGGVRLEPARRGGRRSHFDGPFLESKEVIGGLFFLRLASMDDAVEWALRSSFVEHGALEIRELWRT
jgi:hypothetical protein